MFSKLSATSQTLSNIFKTFHHHIPGSNATQNPPLFKVNLKKYGIVSVLIHGSSDFVEKLLPIDRSGLTQFHTIWVRCFFSRLQGSPGLEVFIAKAWRLESVHMASLVQRIPARGDSMCATVGREGNCVLCSAQAVWPDK